MQLYKRDLNLEIGMLRLTSLFFSVLRKNGVSVDLNFQAVTSQVLWAQMSLTAVFGKGTGGPSSLKTLTNGAPSGI